MAEGSAIWAPYFPDPKSPWDLRRVVHLHRRAGFAATWGELQRDLNDGPAISVDRFLAGKANAHAPAGFAEPPTCWPTPPSRPARSPGSRRGGSTACCSAPTRWASG